MNIYKYKSKTSSAFSWMYQEIKTFVDGRFTFYGAIALIYKCSDDRISYSLLIKRSRGNYKVHREKQASKVNSIRNAYKRYSLLINQLTFQPNTIRNHFFIKNIMTQSESPPTIVKETITSTDSICRKFRFFPHPSKTVPSG